MKLLNEKTQNLLYAGAALTVSIAAGWWHVESGHMMDTVIDFSLHALVVLGVVIALRFVEGAFHHRVGPDRSIDNLQRQLDEIKREQERERESYQRKIGTLEVQVELLTNQLRDTMKHMGVLERDAAELRNENALLKAQMPREVSIIPATPLLHICGDEEFGRLDRTQLNRARVPYRTIENATKRGIEDELQRRREDGTPYWWILVSAHGSKEGVQLADGMAPPWWWNRTIDPDTHLIIFANCDGPEVGDALAGIARRVVVMYGAIPTDDAAAFVLAMFRAKLQGLDADAAFLSARRQVPSIAPFVDIRKA